MQTLVYYCSYRPALCVFSASTSEQCLVLCLCCLSPSLGAPWACLFYGPPLFCVTREGRTEPAFSVAGCICARPWLPPLLSWSSFGAHPVAGDVWRPPRVGERADGWVDGKEEGVGCFVRVYLFQNSLQACSRTSTKLCMLTYLHAHTYTSGHTHLHTHLHACMYVYLQATTCKYTYIHACKYMHVCA